MIISKVTIKRANSDGTYSESIDLLPKEIADYFACQILDWRNVWVSTQNINNDFNEAVTKWNKNEKATKA